MFSDIPNVTVRAGHPYFRIRVPADLVDRFGAKYIKKSLRSTDPDDVRMLAESMASKAKSNFALLRSGILSVEQASALIAEYTFHPKVQSQGKPTRLGELYKLYVIEKSPNWKKKTADAFNLQFKVMLGILGDHLLDKYDRSSCLALRTILLKRLGSDSVNHYLCLLSSVFRWGIRHEYVIRNPAEGMQLEIKKRPSERRKAYDLEDIRRVIAILPDRDGSEPFKFWVPMIAMYSGMRREEICQLYPSDIREVDGVWCFDISGGGDKSVKTDSSDRLVPIHSRLLALGLLDFVEANKKRHNLWGFTQWREVWGKKFGNWYTSTFNRKVTDDPLKCFHSFRHTVADTLKQKGLQESVVAELLGHIGGGITFNRYGKKYLPPRLVEAVEALDYLQSTS